jgi:hypothetical protein
MKRFGDLGDRRGIHDTAGDSALHDHVARAAFVRCFSRHSNHPTSVPEVRGFAEARNGLLTGCKTRRALPYGKSFKP